jgi:TonB-linked SusC/RagA family outer membrane protein
MRRQKFKGLHHDQGKSMRKAKLLIHAQSTLKSQLLPNTLNLKPIMKQNYLFILFFYGLLFTAGQLTAQSPQTLKGKITDDISGEPLVGATIFVKETKEGSVTDVSGNFSLLIKKELPVTLFIRYLGYQEKELDIYEIESDIEIKLRSRQVLSEVVVTAVGIESSRKAINYTLSEVKSEDIIKSREPNITTALSGKVAGVQIGNNGGTPGGASSIRIRGNNSITGNNTPLFILDGVPVDNSIQDILGNITNAWSLATPSNRGVDINPDDIDNVTVLKGPAAAALYGLRAANGAVIINTKRGSKVADKKFQVGFSANFQVDEKNRRLQPRQHKYSNGTNGQYVLTSQDNWGAPLDDLTYSNNQSPYYKDGTIVRKDDPASNGIPIKRFNNEDNFFVKGILQNYNVNVSGKFDKASYYTSVGSLYQTGIVPTTDFFRTTFRFNADYEVTDRLKFAVGANYINSGANNRALQGGYPTSSIRALRNTPDNFDITNGYDEAWKHRESYQLDPTADKPWGASRAFATGNGWDNPYWTLNRNPQKDEVNRYIGYFEANYEILPWLKATLRPGLDQYRDFRNSGFANGSAGIGRGVLNVINYYRRDFNNDLILSGTFKPSQDLDLSVNLGHNYYNSYRYSASSRGDGLIIPDLYSLSNASTVTAFDNTVKKKLVAVYASASFAYRNWLFLNLTGRNEWTSTLAKGKNSFFYPSIGTSLIFTDALNLDNSVLSYGKIRGTFARVGNDADPYSLETYYSGANLSNFIFQSSLQAPFLGSPALASGNNIGGTAYTLGNPDLKPEQITSWEGGLELKFFKNKIGIDATYYSNRSENQILPVTISPTSGYRASLQNSGEVTNKGIELGIDLTAVQTKDWIWDLNFIYYKNISKVESLAQGLTSIPIDGGFNSMAAVGQPFGVFYGTDFARNEKGQVLIDDVPSLANGSANPNYGKPLVNVTPTKLGDPNPKGNASVRSSLTYKAVTLSFLLDTRWGFAINNAPRGQMILNGVDASTEERGVTKVFPGIKKNEGTPNDIPIVYDQELYSRTLYNVTSTVIEKNLYWFRLRDISLTFQLPVSWIEPLKVSRASFAFTGRNFLLNTNYTGSDPDLGARTGQSNATGVDFWTVPNTRSYGASLNVTF